MIPLTVGTDQILDCRVEREGKEGTNKTCVCTSEQWIGRQTLTVGTDQIFDWRVERKGREARACMYVEGKDRQPRVYTDISKGREMDIWVRPELGYPLLSPSYV